MRSRASSSWPALNSSSGIGSTIVRGVSVDAWIKGYSLEYRLTFFQVLLGLDLLDLVIGAKNLAIVIAMDEVDGCDKLARQLHFVSV